MAAADSGYQARRRAVSDVPRAATALYKHAFILEAQRQDTTRPRPRTRTSSESIRARTKRYSRRTGCGSSNRTPRHALARRALAGWRCRAERAPRPRASPYVVPASRASEPPE